MVDQDGNCFSIVCHGWVVTFGDPMVSDAVATDPDLEPDDTDPIYILLRLIWIVYQVAHRIPGQCTSRGRLERRGSFIDGLRFCR